MGLGKDLQVLHDDLQKEYDEFFLGKVDYMDTEELRDAIDNESDRFVEMQQSIANEIGIALSEMVEKDYGKAHIRLRNLQNELNEDIRISKEKETR